jgi:hypothetical protein
MSDAAARPTLIIYRRQACHLCDDAERLLRDELALRARAGHPPIAVSHVDIGGAADLEARYGRRIPVFVMGAVESELVSSARQVREFLERALPRPGT